jgi:hypothetical protein
MQARPRVTRKKNNRAKYLELRIDENGKVIFYNLSKSSVALVEKISGENLDHQSFYCG